MAASWAATSGRHEGAAPWWGWATAEWTQGPGALASDRGAAASGYGARVIVAEEYRVGGT
jgi:hypothetical protein